MKKLLFVATLLASWAVHAQGEAISDAPGMTFVTTNMVATNPSGQNGVSVLQGAQICLNYPTCTVHLESSDGLGVRVTGFGLSLTSGTLGPLAIIRNSDANAGLLLHSNRTNGAGNVAIRLGATVDLSGTAKIISIGDNVDSAYSEKLAVQASGKLVYPSAGAADICGTSTLSSGTVTVATTAVETGDFFFLQRNTIGGTMGYELTAPTGSIVNGTSFVINSYQTTGAIQTSDTSTVNWCIFKKG